MACASVEIVDAAAAIAELRELSTQIQTIVVCGRNGALLSASVQDEAAARIAEAAVSLADGADQVRADLGREALAQLQAATPDGSVFVVCDGDRMAVATTGSDPTVGLVFYDLKTLLRQIAEGNGAAADGAAVDGAVADGAAVAEEDGDGAA
jgi:predicted regulator of Ras-like GTPase activity (Roadblock/LC7/MglB family)